MADAHALRMQHALQAPRDGGSTPEGLRATFAERDKIVHLERYLELLSRHAPGDD